MTIAITSSDLFRDVRAEFLGTYRKRIGRHPILSQIMRLGVQSTRRVEFYAYDESVPTLDRVEHGGEIQSDAYKIRSYSVANHWWGKAVPWHEFDMEDLQIDSIMGLAGRMGNRAGQLAEEVFFQIRGATTNARLLPAIPVAPDGAALYATTAGGVARFGATNGNLLTGSGVASAAAIRSDFWNAIEQYRLMQDTEGQPLLDEGELESRGVVVVFNAANHEVFAETFQQGRTVEVTQNVAGTENVASAAVTNTILESGLKVTLWPTQRVTDNDWDVWAPGAGPEPIFEQIRMPVRNADLNRSNSETAIKRAIFEAVVDVRAGYGVNLPYSTIRVNN